MMNICSNGSFNGFWAKCNVMRLEFVALVGLEPSFGQVDWAYGSNGKV